ncbi:MAG: hypothetical protein N2441_03130 [Rhodocyclaceae bacterium]|nr:hypothetical protein [Rhodocyclaceae bacterium]
MIDFQKQYALWDEFLTVWPASRLATMTLLSNQHCDASAAFSSVIAPKESGAETV